MKIKLFTHNDLDGVGCGILCEVAYKDNINIEYCNYSGAENINVKVKNFILSNEYEEYDMIFITDISVNEEVAELINDNIEAKHIQLLDHHNTAKWLNDKYEWSKVLECVEDGIKHCGTMMFYYELL
ncbi:hypothetical protein [Clostridium ganghwense]|uniref:Phosphoesterase n=1 Tax=Clostridium ganghwense TaxID=312089 RepID=A0ABT4CU29_9CLOT|nr:hypothetical protein [Clostridium ganghwense]MCY6372578.1 hypothetical protein [Clostridium ganghwense]